MTDEQFKTLFIEQLQSQIRAWRRLFIFAAVALLTAVIVLLVNVEAPLPMKPWDLVIGGFIIGMVTTLVLVCRFGRGRLRIL